MSKLRFQYLKIQKTKSVNQYQKWKSSQLLIWTHSPDTATDRDTEIQRYRDKINIALYNIDDDERVYRKEIQNFAKWCDINFLNVNVQKTKEIVLDFRKCDMKHYPIIIKNEEVQIDDNHKYIGITVSDNLSWSEHSSNISTKLN